MCRSLPTEPNDDLARVQSDAHGSARSTPCPRRRPQRAPARRASPASERGVAGPHRVVLVRERGAEERHDAVAHHLADGALVAVDRLHHHARERDRAARAPPRDRDRRAAPWSPSGRRTARDLLALADHRMARAQDLLGEMLGGVAPGRGESAVGGQAGAAFGTELRLEGNVALATGASHAADDRVAPAKKSLVRRVKILCSSELLRR